MKKIVILSGAGISAESGIKTFRDSNGLWENHKIEDVASPEGFARNPELVLEFYNLRRRQLSEVNPNEAHHILAELQKDFDVHIITQNVDDLHERAGSKNIIHLHGELKKVRPVNDEESIVPWEGDLNLGDLDENGIQLRPHIVWFGEMVPEMENAATIASTADILLVIGTSLQVYPAASLLHYVPAGWKFL
jgi:NAD-dependent deacetylase